MSDILAQWRDTIRAATTARRPLQLRGAGTKDFLGRQPSGEIFDTRYHRGIVSSPRRTNGWPSSRRISARARPSVARWPAACPARAGWRWGRCVTSCWA
jgi:glycolate oxidase FAD binding subunit